MCDSAAVAVRERKVNRRHIITSHWHHHFVIYPFGVGRHHSLDRVCQRRLEGGSDLSRLLGERSLNWPVGVIHAI